MDKKVTQIRSYVASQTIFVEWKGRKQAEFNTTPGTKYSPAGEIEGECGLYFLSPIAAEKATKHA